MKRPILHFPLPTQEFTEGVLVPPPLTTDMLGLPLPICHLIPLPTLMSPPQRHGETGIFKMKVITQLCVMKSI